jgi:hypothetical protein
MAILTEFPMIRGVSYWRRLPVVGGTILALLLPLGAAGCSEEVKDQFASAALPAVEAGLKSLMEGIITGLVTVAQTSITGSNTGTNGTDTGGTDTGGTGNGSETSA